MPPGVQGKWDDNNIWSQAQLIAYDQIRGYEEGEEQEAIVKALVPRI